MRKSIVSNAKLTKTLANKNALKSLAGAVAIGAGIGLAIDMYKNHKAKKSENV